jgi:AraC-like DNA-binding protein/ligand-binding sensor protein
MNADTYLIERLSRSQFYAEYQKAFGEATELPLTLRPLESWRLAHRHQVHENPLCAMLARPNRTCAACLEVQQRAIEGAKNGPATVTCFTGLCDTAVPIRLGERIIGFLETGQVALEAPSETQFSRIADQIVKWGSQVDLERLKGAYFRSKVLSSSRYAGVIHLLEIFGQHLSLVANQIALGEAQTESPMVRRAKAYIAGHQADPLHLEDVAKAMHVSTFYFCKLFKRATGLTFTDYLGRVRVEKAKTLLLNPHLRVTEIAYGVGFQSLTHFNRVFRKLTGESPSFFRANGMLSDRAARSRDLPRKVSALPARTAIAPKPASVGRCQTLTELKTSYTSGGAGHFRSSSVQKPNREMREAIPG